MLIYLYDKRYIWIFKDIVDAFHQVDTWKNTRLNMEKVNRIAVKYEV